MARAHTQKAPFTASSIDANLLQQAVSSSTDGIVITTAEPGLPILYVNPSFERLTGYCADELISQSYHLLQDGLPDEKIKAEIKEILEKREAFCIEFKNIRKNGEPFWNELSISPVRDTKGNVTHFIGIQKDITRRKNLQELLYTQSIKDPMTDLYNRRGFFSLAKKQLALAERNKHSTSLIVIDIDNLKEINDELGHLQGDSAINNAAQCLTTVFRDSDLIARIGGDEFVVLFSEEEQHAETPYLLRLEHTVKQLNQGSSLPYTLSLSTGLARLNEGEDKTLDELIQEADLAMYTHKNQKKKAQATLKERN